MGFTGTSCLGFARDAGLVAVLQTTPGQEAMESFGWRVPFLVAGSLTGITLYFRYRIEESPTFAAVLKESAAEAAQTGWIEKNAGVVEVIRTQGRFVLPVIGTALVGNAIAYTMTSFIPK